MASVSAPPRLGIPGEGWAEGLSCDETIHSIFILTNTSGGVIAPVFVFGNMSDSNELPFSAESFEPWMPNKLSMPAICREPSTLKFKSSKRRLPIRGPALFFSSLYRSPDSDKADKQLEVLGVQKAQAAWGVSVYQNIVAAEQTRNKVLAIRN